MSLTKWAEIYSGTYGGTGTVEPTVIHPTAATPSLYNCFTAPFVFLVLGLLYDYHKWLVTAAVHKVSSRLGTLFVENRKPVAHDYAVSLQNYNMRTETEVLRERAHDRVRKSVVELLFDKLSDTSRLIAEFIRKYHNNIDERLTGVIHDSVQVSLQDVTRPILKITGPIYNVYIHPPTADSGLLETGGISL